MQSHATHRFAALALSIIVTVSIFAGVSSLASTPSAHALLARTAATQATG